MDNQLTLYNIIICYISGFGHI